MEREVGAYSQLTYVRPVGDGSYDKDVETLLNDTQGQGSLLGQMRSGIYRRDGETFAFRVDVYHAHAEWLCLLDGLRADELAFTQLIDYSLADGAIGAEEAAMLLKDFDAYAERAREYVKTQGFKANRAAYYVQCEEDSLESVNGVNLVRGDILSAYRSTPDETHQRWWLEAYDNWHRASALAADGGGINLLNPAQ